MCAENIYYYLKLDQLFTSINRISRRQQLAFLLSYSHLFCSSLFSVYYAASFKPHDPPCIPLSHTVFCVFPFCAAFCSSLFAAPPVVVVLVAVVFVTFYLWVLLGTFVCALLPGNRFAFAFIRFIRLQSPTAFHTTTRPTAARPRTV